MRGNLLKRLLVVGLSCGVFIGDFLRDVCLRLVGQRARIHSVALLYHSIPHAQRALFARQLDILSRLAVPVRANIRCPLDPAVRHVAVTFDDGLGSFAENAWPELARRGIAATVFVVAEKMGRTPDWVNYTPGHMPTERTLSLEQLRGLPDTVTVGSHSLTHRMLTEVGETEAATEIETSRCRLEALLQKQVNLFSFPYGECSGRLIEQCRRAGYARVFTSLPRPAFSDPDEFVTGRVDVLPTDWPIEFRLKVVGAYRWLPYAFVMKRTVLGSAREADQ